MEKEPKQDTKPVGKRPNKILVDEELADVLLPIIRD